MPPSVASSLRTLTQPIAEAIGDNCCVQCTQQTVAESANSSAKNRQRGRAGNSKGAATKRGNRSLKLVFADSEVTRNRGATSLESEREDIGTMTAAAMIVIGGLNHFRAFSKSTAVPVARLAAHYGCVPVAPLLAAAESLRCAAFVVFRDDAGALTRLWLADRAGVLEHAERHREDARKHERIAEDLTQFAKTMREQAC